MKKIILLLILALILGVGTIGGLAMFGKGPFPNLTKSFQSVIGSSTTEPTAETKDRVYDLGTFIIPLITNHAIGRQIGMDLAVVVDADAAGRVSSDLPRLQNALLVDLYDFIRLHSDTHSAADKEAIRQRLVKVAQHLFGENAIHNVVIKSLYDR
jgi:hypothetical protein